MYGWNTLGSRYTNVAGSLGFISGLAGSDTKNHVLFSVREREGDHSEC